MHVNNFTLERPSDELLSHTTRVTICDPIFKMHAMRRYCWENGLSLVWSEAVDVSDFSYEHDHIAAFYFINESDATLFTLKFR